MLYENYMYVCTKSKCLISVASRYQFWHHITTTHTSTYSICTCTTYTLFPWPCLGLRLNTCVWGGWVGGWVLYLQTYAHESVS